MKIVIELTPNQAYSVTELWNAQRLPEVNAQGQSVYRRIYSSPEEFVADIVRKTIVQQAIRDFPPPSLSDHMEKKRLAEEALAAAIAAPVMATIERP